MPQKHVTSNLSFSEAIDWALSVDSTNATPEELAESTVRMAEMAKRSDERKRAFEAGETEGESIVVMSS